MKKEEFFGNEKLCCYLTDALFMAVETSIKNFRKIDPEYMISVMTGIRILNRDKIKDEYSVHKFCWIFMYVLSELKNKGMKDISSREMIELIKLNWDKPEVPEMR